MRGKSAYIILFIFMLAFPSWAGNSSMSWVSLDKKEFSRELESLNKLVARLQHCQVNMSDASYADYYTTEYHEQSKGYYKRNGSLFHTYMLGIHTIQDKDCRVVIDSAKKIIMIGDPTNSMNNILDASIYETLLKGCSAIRMSHSEGSTYYRLEFSPGHELSAYEFSVKDSLPQKITIYYSKEVKQGTMVSKPRMEIIFSDWQTSVKNQPGEFSIDKYVVKKGDAYSLKPPYAGKFKLLDERVLSKTAKK